MNIGSMKTRVAIEYRAAGQDATGKPNGAWLTLDNVWAEISESVYREPETVQAAHDASLVRSTFTIRRRNDVDSSMRVNYGGTIFDIRAVVNDYAKRQVTTLYCERVHG